MLGSRWPKVIIPAAASTVVTAAAMPSASTPQGNHTSIAADKVARTKNAVLIAALDGHRLTDGKRRGRLVQAAALAGVDKHLAATVVENELAAENLGDATVDGHYALRIANERPRGLLQRIDRDWRGRCHRLDAVAVVRRNGANAAAEEEKACSRDGKAGLGH
ncbi:MAG TPA: hypothetical protein VF702_03480 [Allosphingosinicella sp.]